MPPGRLCPAPRCGELIYPPATRCPTHQPHQRAQQARQQQAKRARRPAISYAEQQRRRQTVAAWIAERGLLCPGWHTRPAHPVASPQHLTAAHVYPVDGHPEREHGPLVVRCIWCNAAQGTQPG